MRLFGIGDLVELGTDDVKELVEEKNIDGMNHRKNLRRLLTFIILLTVADAMSVDYGPVVYNEPRKHVCEYSTATETVAPEQVVSVTCNQSNDVASTAEAKLQKPISLPKEKPFNREAFQKSFPMPELHTSKKKKEVQKEKRSTVITSEAWKEFEKKKLEEKERVEAEKEARKMEREKKRVLAAQLKAEKELIKEQKKKAKTEIDVKKKLKKN